jgi:uroporphyrinogen-III synthase
MENQIKVLCTRSISQELVEEAAGKGITIDILPFITTEPIENIEVQQEIENALLLSTTVIFTSMNAVEAVAEFLLDAVPDWRIYCIGNTTRELVIKYFGEHAVAGFAQDAVDLANLAAADEAVEEVIFFCGNQRRPELPAILQRHEKQVQEIVVYETIALPQKIQQFYHGILFFSPSAVESFFELNKAAEGTVFFAIGRTTAAAIKNFCNNKIIIGNQPGKENLAETMLEYFT